MALYGNIGSGDGLLPGGMKPVSGQILTSNFWVSRPFNFDFTESTQVTVLYNEFRIML